MENAIGDNFPIEVWVGIIDLATLDALDIAWKDSDASQLAANLTCKAWRYLSLPTLFHTLRLDWRKKRLNVDTIDPPESELSVLRFVLCLVVHEACWTGCGLPENLARIAHRCVNLRECHTHNPAHGRIMSCSLLVFAHCALTLLQVEIFERPVGHFSNSCTWDA